MQRHQLAAALVLALAAGAAGCDDDDETGPDTPRFTAALAASKEVEPPTPITSGAAGTTSFTLSGTTVSYTIDVTGLSSNAMAAHIHGPASATENAGVIVPLNPVAPQTNGRIATGSFTAANITAAGVSFDSLLVLMRNGNSYVNVHTVNHPAGEARGQIQTVP
jgi:Cu/Zn superoxide dismutase